MHVLPFAHGLISPSDVHHFYWLQPIKKVMDFMILKQPKLHSLLKFTYFWCMISTQILPLILVVKLQAPLTSVPFWFHVFFKQSIHNQQIQNQQLPFQQLQYLYSPYFFLKKNATHHSFSVARLTCYIMVHIFLKRTINWSEAFETA